MIKRKLWKINEELKKQENLERKKKTLKEDEWRSRKAKAKKWPKKKKKKEW